MSFELYDLKEKQEYCNEVALLEHKEWGEQDKNDEELRYRIDQKIQSMKNQFSKVDFCKLILLDEGILVRIYINISKRL